MIYDTHIHFDHPLFENKGPELMREMLEKGIGKVVIPAITFDSNKSAREMFSADEFVGRVFFAAGVHPKTVNCSGDWDKDMKRQFEAWLGDKRTVAVKSGLDFCKKRLLDDQKRRQGEFLRMLIGYANKYDLPLVLHVRDLDGKSGRSTEAAEEAIRILKENPIETSAEVHCFTYDSVVAERFMEAGVRYFGIGGAVTKGDAVRTGLKDFVRNMPFDSLLLETDGPFQIPEIDIFPRPECMPETRVCTSLCLPVIVEEIARIRGVTSDEIIRLANANAEFFFQTAMF